MSLYIKICGLTDHSAVKATVEEGANAIGFNFYPPSPRYLSPELAADLALAVPQHVLRVAVMLRPQQADWEEIYATFKPDCLQADADCLKRLRLPEGLRTLPVYRDHDHFDFDSVPADSAYLFESAVSGKGQPPSWERAADLARRTNLVLAGGLSPENVAEAIRRVRPWGVDVSSGVEAARGVKDPDRVRRFIRCARGAELAS